jgi:hypothetical protein
MCYLSMAFSALFCSTRTASSALRAISKLWRDRVIRSFSQGGKGREGREEEEGAGKLELVVRKETRRLEEEEGRADDSCEARGLAASSRAAASWRAKPDGCLHTQRCEVNVGILVNVPS